MQPPPSYVYDHACTLKEIDMSCNMQHCEVLTRPSHAHTLHYGVAVRADLHAALLQVGAPLLHHAPLWACVTVRNATHFIHSATSHEAYHRQTTNPTVTHYPVCE